MYTKDNHETHLAELGKATSFREIIETAIGQEAWKQPKYRASVRAQAAAIGEVLPAQYLTDPDPAKK